MTKWQIRSKRSTTGSKYHRIKKKKKYQRGRDYLSLRLAETRIVKSKRVTGGNVKRVLLQDSVANVAVHGAYQKTKILTVSENKANPQFVRRNVICKGAILDTELGKVKVTSRPGQVGMINAVLVSQQ